MTMIGIILVAHDNMASALRKALEHIVGAQQNLIAIDICADDDMEVRRQDILDSVAKVDTGKGVVLLTDMFGGTPSNLSLSAMDKANVEVIAGVNLPMLVKLASIRNDKTLNEAVDMAQEAGKKYINVASKLLD